MYTCLALLFQAGEAAATEGAEKSALDQFLENPWDLLSVWGLKILAALAVFVIGRWVAMAIRGSLRKVLNARGVDSTLTTFLGSIVFMLVMTMVVIAALGQLGVNTTSFVAVLGAAGLAVGFALQGSLGNFASGVMIIFFRPFKAGDFVEIAGTSGVILEVQVFATVLKTGDNKRVIIPNGSVMGGNIVNYSAHDTRRVDMVFGCGYGDDVRKAKEVLTDIVKADERVLQDPAPVVALSELGDSSVNFVVRPWVKTADYWDVYWAMHETVKLRFDEAGLEIPFPQRDVHMHQTA